MKDKNCGIIFRSKEKSYISEIKITQKKLFFKKIQTKKKIINNL